MIAITDIKYGWATLYISYASFVVSYLSDLMGEIDRLLDLDDDGCQKIYLEGESGGDLILVSYLTYEHIEDKTQSVINIVWQRVFSREQYGHTLIKLPYEKLKAEWAKEKVAIKDEYEKNFGYAFMDEDSSIEE